MLHIHVDLEKIPNIEFDYATLNLPYYVMNTNEDVKIIEEFSKASDLCFKNSISHFKNNIKLLLIDDAMRTHGNSVTVCPKRTDILEYANWFTAESELYKKVSETAAVEVPLLFNYRVAQRMLSALNNSRIVIYHSHFFNKYFDCLYVVKSSKKTECPKITNIEQFRDAFNEAFMHKTKESLLKLSEVAAYVKMGNFYGAKFNKYERDLKTFAESVRDIV